MADDDHQRPRFTRPGFSGQDVPFYGLRFDKKGNLLSPLTQQAVIDHIAAKGFTDTIIFSHGWNNEWDDALDYYISFLDGVGSTATRHASDMPEGMKPLMIGLAWPSAILTWPWDRTPEIAAGYVDEEDTDEPDDIAVLTEDLSEAEAAELRVLVAGKEELTAEEVDRLAALLAPSLSDAPDPADPFSVASAEDLARTLRAPELAVSPPQTEEEEDDEDLFRSGGTIGQGATDAQAAGLLSDVFGLRTVLRLATVLKMKDRAGVVGGRGVADLVSGLLGQTATRLHIVGHSYGTKVVLTAASRATISRKLHSVLLLQPAINHYAFAAEVLGGGQGGLRNVLGRTERPILSTHSADDMPLRHVFHLAADRRRDLGEDPTFAAGVSAYSAMGGYGPAGMAPGELQRIDMPEPEADYPAIGDARIIDLKASGKIKGHSQIMNNYVYWAMHQNLKRGGNNG